MNNLIELLFIARALAVIGGGSTLAFVGTSTAISLLAPAAAGVVGLGSYRF